ncbi:MAG: InlB B-repeat-containing protein, partial [Alphaproteobacteria bacterium]|nr:InlB B-repeat-containing protein [Alphaproteobacteria bacterium]
AGAHTIEFDGHATGYSTIGSTADGAAISFNTQTNTGNAYANDVASISGSLGAIFPTLGGTNDKMPMFFGTFKQCRSLTSIPAGLFSGVTGTRTSMFRETFDRCSSLVDVPESLFSGITGLGKDSLFRSTFNETAMTAIPENLFAGVTSSGNNMFRYLFGNVSTLSGYIPPSTFAGLIANGSPTTDNMWDSSFLGTSLATSCENFPNTEQYTTHYEGTGKRTWDGKVSCQTTIRYNVTYDCGGGTGTAPTDSTDYMPNATVTTLANTCTPPTHKLFDKWSCGGDDVTAGGTFTIDDDTTCTAQYIDAFTVSYDCGVGTGTAPTDSTDYAPNATVTTLANTCTAPAHKLFDKWSCGGNNISAGSTFTITANTTCAAQYSDMFTVSYDCGSGTGTAPTDSTDYAPNATVTTLANTCTPPTGEHFASWLCGGNNINAGSTFTITANTTCTAQYGTEASVSYTCGDGTGNAPVDTTSYVIGETVTTATVANTTCTKNGYTLTGWSCGGNAVTAGGTFTITNDITCTAQ